MSSDFGSSDEEESTNNTELSHIGTNNVWVTAGIIVADVVGAGVLGMPHAIARFGWLVGGVVMAASLAANVHVSILMWRVLMGCKACAGARTYMDLCRGAFAMAPQWQRDAVVVVGVAGQQLFNVCLMSIYVLTAGKGFGMLFYRLRVCLPQWSLLTGTLILPFALTARKMGKYQSLVWVNILTICGTICIPLAYYAVNGTDEAAGIDSEWFAVADMSPKGVLSGLSTFAFGMTSQFILVEIIAEMRDPNELPKAYAQISSTFQLSVFMLAGLGGYYYLGSKVSGMISENLPFNKALQAAGLCLLVHMLISYVIKGVVFCNFAVKMFRRIRAGHNAAQKVSGAEWSTVVLAGFVGAWLLANVVPFFGDAVDLVGASVCPLTCLVLPILMFVRYYVDAGDSRPRVSALEWACMLVEIVVALALMVFGTYSSLQTLRRHWHTYGYPFACHCEGMWNTCECSSSHVGMDSCSAVAVG